MNRVLLPFLLGLATPALAGTEAVVRLDDPSLDLVMAVGKQVNVRFSDDFARGRLASVDFDNVVLSDIPAGRVCFFGRDLGLDTKDPKIRDVVRADEGDICAPRDDVSVRFPAQTAEGAPPAPFFATDTRTCTWVWRAGRDIGLWTEDCSFATGHWAVAYDEANDQFALSVDGGEPYPVVRQFHLAPGEELAGLLTALKSKGLIRDTADCQFAPAADQQVPAGWSAFEVVPTGKLKEMFEAQPSDEVPEPPCGEIGLMPDGAGFFLVHKDHPDRVVHVDLGQDGTMIEPFTLRFF